MEGSLMTNEALQQMIESEIRKLLNRPGQPTPQVSARLAGFVSKEEGGHSDVDGIWNIECGVTMSLSAGEHMSPEQVKAAIRHHMLFFVGGS
jgi:hypothetical protein